VATQWAQEMSGARRVICCVDSAMISSLSSK
jgi:hypothetical protein